MSRNSSLDLATSLWKRLRDRLTRRNGKEGVAKRAQRRLRFEMLEGRQLLAADLAAISGVVFDDFNGNGLNPGEEVNGANVQLYRDTGDGVLQVGSDTLVATKVTGTNGAYRFDNLTVGDYFVRQPAQSVASKALLEYTSSIIKITAADVGGVTGTVIDSFDTTTQTATAMLPGGTGTASNASVTSDAIGGERDLFASLTSALGELRLNVNTFVPNRLEFTAGSNTNGRRVITWDGTDNNGAALNATGLNNADVTQSGANTAMQLTIGADHDNGLATIRVYTDAGNWSKASVAIPNTGGSASQQLVIPLTAFTTGGGAGATFSNVGAIELELEGITAVDGQVDLISMLGPKNFSQNFPNFEQIDLSVTKQVNAATPKIGDNVTFTITVTNAGPNTATNVKLSDTLPGGMTFGSFSATQGAYVNGTGVWTVGTLAKNATASLQIVANVATAGTKTNIAQVSAADQFDIDSTPNNNIASEDDQASAVLSPQLADLSLTKSVDSSRPNCHDTVTFTLTVTNSGPTGATGVAVKDLLPAGLNYVSSTAAQGSYNSTTGIWTVGSLAGNSSSTLKIVAKLNDLMTPATNVAQISASDQPDPDSTPNNSIASEDDQASVTVTPQIADLSLTKTVNNATPNLNENVTFTITVANGGPDAATNVAVSDLLPSGATFVSANPSQGTYNNGTGSWVVGTVASGGSATLQVVAKITGSGMIMNVAQVSSSDQCDPDSTPANSIPAEDDQGKVTVTPQVIDLSLTKDVNTFQAKVGDNATFTITVTNNGPTNATGVQVLDQLPPGLVYVSSATTQGTFNNGTGVWTVGSLNVGASATLSLTAKLTADAVVTNIAQVSRADQTDIDSTPNNSDPFEDDQASASLFPPVRPQSFPPTLTKRSFISR